MIPSDLWLDLTKLDKGLQLAVVDEVAKIHKKLDIPFEDVFDESLKSVKANIEGFMYDNQKHGFMSLVILDDIYVSIYNEFYGTEYTTTAELEDSIDYEVMIFEYDGTRYILQLH